MEIIIRKANLKDAAAISRIWEVICSERIYTAVNNPFTPQQEQIYLSSLSKREGIFIADIEGRIVGFQSLDLWAKYTDSFDHVGVIGTFILPEWRRKNMGNQLTFTTFDFARKNNYEKIVLYIRAGNIKAQTFYKRIGFVQKGVLTRQVKIDDQYEDEIFMEIFL